MRAKVTVLMPVYNAEKYLKQAIESVLAQTFTNFEFVIIDDGSDDGSQQIIRKYRDKRIRLIVNKKKLGISKSLNKGISHAKGKYIARMDADDISMRNRIEIQVGFMERNKDVAVAGSWIKIISGSGIIYARRKYPLVEERIRAGLLLANPLCHPSIIMRKSVVKKNKLFYNPKFKRAQDYELWVRFSRKFRIVNIPKYLIKYRLHQNHADYSDISYYNKYLRKIYKFQFKSLKINLSHEEEVLYQKYVRYDMISSREELKKIDNLLFELINQNNVLNLYNKSLLRKIISRHWFIFCLLNTRLNFNLYKYYYNSKTSNYYSKSIVLRMFFGMKSTMPNFANIFLRN